MNGFHTRSALVRHAERGLGIRQRPYGAREIECAINPIPQPAPNRGTQAQIDRLLGREAGPAATLASAYAFAAVMALAAFIVVMLAIAQNLPGECLA